MSGNGYLGEEICYLHADVKAKWDGPTLNNCGWAYMCEECYRYNGSPCVATYLHTEVYWEKFMPCKYCSCTIKRRYMKQHIIDEHER